MCMNTNYVQSAPVCGIVVLLLIIYTHRLSLLLYIYREDCLRTKLLMQL